MIDDMAVYIANLGKYNEGYLVGAWFTFPIDEEDVKEKIGLNERYEEYAIHDTDNFPVTIGEYVSIEELNEMYEMIEELPDYIVECLDEFISHYGTLEEVVEHGYEVCRKIKQVMPVPIIFVTSRDTNADELKSIQVGGIDFITKPYDTLILLEKIKRALQLSNPSNFRELVKKDCTLDLHLSILKYQEQSIELTRNEFRILYYFFMNEDKVISKEELLEKLWNDKYYIDENVLLVNMTRLKKKMKEIGIVHLLENIRGKGWKL